MTRIKRSKWTQQELRAKRRTLVKERDCLIWRQQLLDKLKSVKKSKGLTMDFPSSIEGDPTYAYLKARLLHNGKPIIETGNYIKREQGKVILEISEVQGLESSTEDRKSILKKTGDPASVNLVQMVIDAAYKTGIDSVKLQDIEQTNSYKNPLFKNRPKLLREKKLTAEINRRQIAMRHLYNIIKSRCGFKKKSGEFFVINFP
ncbi:MAG: hypothetical protein CL944_02855 [Candidatus Diapherotrites archaeon]|uniref:Uncharacterized protein n=1 Tax=Candidatus Iainarchaeum sp. TaxID=3101447 RepID=A0A2D6LQB6_9ARCH|nr:hypothetical protein [Candidatus Diapherotrites archaeon]|tara:strand:+ start:4371 stop:4979 length:609 start_codon:yes stop_codon:yes gene_type:complete